MKLSVDGLVLIDSEPKTATYLKEIKEALAMLRLKTGKRIMLDWHDSLKSKDPKDPKKFEVPAAFRLPNFFNVTKKGITQKWVCYEEAVPEEGNKVRYEPRRINLKDTLNFSSANADEMLLYFMVFISPYCEKVADPKFKALQNPNDREKKYYRILMPETESANAAQAGKQNAQISSIIFDKLTEGDMKTILKGTYNVDNVDGMQKNQLSVTLNTLATGSQENRDKFLMDFNINPSVEIKSLVMTAKEKAIIMYDGRPAVKCWKWVDANGKGGEMICKVTGGQKPEDVINDYFKSHEAELNVLKQLIEKINAKQ